MFYHYLLLGLLCLFISNPSNSQQIFNASDLSQFRASSLTDEDIIKYLAEVKNSGMTVEQVEKIALIKGMNPAELDKLRQRVLGLNQTAAPADNPT